MEVGIKEMKKNVGRRNGTEITNTAGNKTRDTNIGRNSNLIEHNHLQNTQTQNPRSAQTITSALKHLYNLEVQHPTLQTGSREWQPPAILLAHIRET